MRFSALLAVLLPGLAAAPQPRISAQGREARAAGAIERVAASWRKKAPEPPSARPSARPQALQKPTAGPAPAKPAPLPEPSRKSDLLLDVAGYSMMGAFYLYLGHVAAMALESGPGVTIAVGAAGLAATALMLRRWRD